MNTNQSPSTLDEKMTIQEFIRRFLDVADLDYSINEIFMMTLEKSIDLIYSDEDPNNDYYAEALEMCQTEKEIKELIKENTVYYDIFLSALIIIFDELTVDADWNDKQKEEISKLLDYYESTVTGYGTLG
jgi:hypothetical protein